MKKFMTIILMLSLFLTIPASAIAGNFIGKYCFQYDDLYENIWEWDVNQVGESYQITGIGSNQIPPSAMSGGGAVDGNTLKLTIDERMNKATGEILFGEHYIELDLSSLNGIDYARWYSLGGIVFVSYPDGLTLSRIPCPSSDDEVSGDGILIPNR